jgi:DNA-directed RNA polymerase specialized sigma24 family protein
MIQFAKPNASPDSPELGWLILNPQVDDETLGAMLLATYQARLVRLAAAFLPSPADALAAIDATMAWVLLHRAAYHSTESGRAWLYARALQEFVSSSAPAGLAKQRISSQALIDAFDPTAGAPPHFADLIQSLPKEQALLLVLYYVHDLSVEEISGALCLPLEQIQAGFDQLRDRLIEHQRVCAVCASPSSELTGAEWLLTRSFANPAAAVDTRFNFSENDLRAWTNSILKRIAMQRKFAGDTRPPPAVDPEGTSAGPSAALCRTVNRIERPGKNAGFPRAQRTDHCAGKTNPNRSPCIAAPANLISGDSLPIRPARRPATAATRPHSHRG